MLGDSIRKKGRAPFLFSNVATPSLGRRQGELLAMPCSPQERLNFEALSRNHQPTKGIRVTIWLGFADNFAAPVPRHPCHRSSENVVF
jgi:hypothetical protein